MLDPGLKVKWVKNWKGIKRKNFQVLRKKGRKFIFNLPHLIHVDQGWLEQEIEDGGDEE